MRAPFRFLGKWCGRSAGGTSANDPPPVVLYTREGCHLCDEARAMLESHGLEVTAVDIDADPELCSRYTDCVPVVVIDGKERFRGRVNEVLLRRLLGRRPESE
jgi:glutaredoxin